MSTNFPKKKPAPGRNPENLGFYKPEKGQNSIPGKNVHTVLLTNEFCLTKKLNRFYARETFHIFHKKWQLVVHLLSAVTLLAGLMVLLIFHFLPVGIPLVVLGVYFIFMASFGYLYGAAVSYRNLASFFGEPIQMKVDFHKQYFSVVTEKGNSDFLYKQVIKYISFTEYDIWIVAAEGIIQHGQLVDKRAFSPEELNIYYSIVEKNGLDKLG